MAGERASESRRYDLHCHLDFAGDPRALATGLNDRGIDCLSVTVTPEGFERARTELSGCANVRVGLGLHPWWVEGDSCGAERIERFESLLGAARFVGEVGLDFGARHEASRAAQVAAFERIASGCATQGNKVLSLHAVRAAGVVLDVLEHHDVPSDNACIFHWFSGTSDELQRAIKLGCFFSVGERMLATGRGRAYAQAIPLNRLLLETDLPPEAGSVDACAKMDVSLREALSALETVRGEGAAERIAGTSASLLAACR